MKRLVVICVLTLLFCKIRAQDAVTTTEQLIADIFEQYSAETEIDVDYESFYEDLMSVSQNPIQINSATRDELQHLPFLSDSQIENLLFYIYKFGPMQTIYELQLVEGLDMTDIRRMLPFVALGDVTGKEQRLIIRDVVRYGRNAVLFRLDRGLETKEGYRFAPEEDEQSTDVNSGKYLGSPFYNSLKYQFHYKDRVMAGLTAEKDAGEQFAGKTHIGYDFYSFYTQINNIGKFKRIVVGDFRANFGFGLVLHSDFGTGKSAYVLNVMPRNSGLKKFSSTDEYNFFRGAGATVKLGRVDVSAFYSNKMIDGDTINNTFKSINKSGYHRTAAEYETKGTVNQQVMGVNACLYGLYAQIGFTAVHTRFNHQLMPDKSVYNYFYFAGDEQSVAGLNYRIRWRKLNVFGETALTDKLASATLNGFSFSPISTVSFVVLHRYISPEFDTFFANTFTETSRVNNESGFYLGTEIRPLRKWRLAAYADCYRFAWPKFGIDAPSVGSDYLLQADFAARRDLSMCWRLKYEEKMSNQSVTDAVMPVVVPLRKGSMRYQLTYNWGNFSFRNLIEGNLVRKGNADCTYGITALQDVGYEIPKFNLKFDFRYQFFDATDYDNRLYTFEKDVLYAFSIPMYYGKGSRYYVNLRYDLSRKMSIWFKFAQTVYADDRETLSSGNETINGNRKTDIRLLLKWEL